MGAVATVIGFALWAVGTAVIPGATGLPWRWQPVAFVFHVSMFYGQVACFGYVATGLGYRKTEHVADVVADEADIEHAERVEVS